VDAFLSDLPLPAQEYLHWLRQSHFSADDWLCFERALDAHDRYEQARAEAERRCLAVESIESVFNDNRSVDRQLARRKMFLSLSRQIIAQEDLALMIRHCEEYYRASGASADVGRLLEWLRGRLGASEEQVSRLLGYRAGR
jgi:hypothetical protein